MISGRTSRSRSRKISVLVSNCLGSSLNHKIAIRQLAAFGHWLNACQCRVLIRRGDFVFRNFAIEIRGDGSQRALHKTFLDIAQNHLVSATREYMRDAVPHCARADNSDPPYVHKCLVLSDEQ